MNEFEESEIVYIRNMRFADDPASIDIRLNGRPYLIYSVEGENVYLFKISSSYFKPEYCYHQIYLKQRYKAKKCNGRRKKKSKAKPSYVDLRYIIQIPIEELVRKTQEFGGRVKGRKISAIREKVSKKDFIEIKQKIKDLSAINELRIRTLMLMQMNGTKF